MKALSHDVRTGVEMQRANLSDLSSSSNGDGSAEAMEADRKEKLAGEAVMVGRGHL
jgi:hypothetical protein